MTGPSSAEWRTDNDDYDAAQTEWWKRRRRNDRDTTTYSYVCIYIYIWYTIYTHKKYTRVNTTHIYEERLAARHHRISRPDNNNNNIYNSGARGECVPFRAIRLRGRIRVYIIIRTIIIYIILLRVRHTRNTVSADSPRDGQRSKCTFNS